MRYKWLVVSGWILWSSNTDLQIWRKTHVETPLKAVAAYNSHEECERKKSASVNIWVKDYRVAGMGGATGPIGNRVVVYDKPNDAFNGKVVRFECWPSGFDPRQKATR
jgi:hypothetical protein